MPKQHIPQSSVFVASQKYRSFVLGLLFLVGLFNYADRFMLAVLLPDIKTDLDLSDTEIGFITGIGFSVLYALCGIPIARLADLYSRRVIISSVVAIWSVMTAVCGLAQSFLQLATARILVGIGEAGATPSSQSLISDYYPKELRASSLAIFALSSPVGILIGFLLGGLIAGAFGWRFALFSFGIPGLLLALLILLTLRDPPRGFADYQGVAGEDQKLIAPLPFWETWRSLFRRKSFFHACMAGGVFSFMFLAFAQWAPSFFSRSHGMATSEIGTWLAFTIGFSQISAIYLGGVLADYLTKRDMRLPLWMSSLAMTISIPFFVGAYTADQAQSALFLLFPALFFVSLQGATLYAVVQNVASVRTRSVAAAILVLFFNLVGGLGPQIIGIVSDLLAPSFGDESLRYALLTMTVAAVSWTALHFFLAARTIRMDVESD